MDKKKGASKLIVGVVILLIGVGLLIWALSGRSTPAPAETSVQNTSEAAQENADEAAVPSADAESSAIIAFTNTGFTPETLSVKKGAVVTVRNESSANVQFSSNEHPSHRDNTEMNLKSLAPGESASYTANTAGEWGFHDHIDESKTGTITVTE